MTKRRRNHRGYPVQYKRQVAEEYLVDGVPRATWRATWRTALRRRCSMTARLRFGVETIAFSLVVALVFIFLRPINQFIYFQY